jgi:hypothetical protein
MKFINPFTAIAKQRRDEKNLTTIVAAMKSEDTMMIEVLAAQVDAKLRAMPRDEALALIHRWYGCEKQ